MSLEIITGSHSDIALHYHNNVTLFGHNYSCGGLTVNEKEKEKTIINVCPKILYLECID